MTFQALADALFLLRHPFSFVARVLLLAILPYGINIKYFEVTAQEQITVRLHWNHIPWKACTMALRHNGQEYALLNPAGLTCNDWSPRGNYICQVKLVHWKREATIIGAEVEEPVGRILDWRR